MAWELRERAADSVTVVELRGRFTLGASGDALEARLQELIAAGTRKLLLDLSGVEVLDSRGIKGLVRAFISAQKRDQQVKLMKLSARAQQVLEITRLLSVFEVFEDERKALESFPA